MSNDGADCTRSWTQSAQTACGGSSDPLNGVRGRYIRVTVGGHGAGAKAGKDAASAPRGRLGVSRVRGQTTDARARPDAVRAAIAHAVGVQVRGDGVEKTRLDFPISFGSNSLIGGHTRRHRSKKRPFHRLHLQGERAVDRPAQPPDPL